MVMRRNNCACAIRSAAPEAAIAGMKAAGTPELRPLWRSRKAISREAVSLAKDLCGFRNGRRAREIARHAPPGSAVRTPDRIGERVEGLVDVVRSVRRPGEGIGARRSSFHGVAGSVMGSISASRS